MTARVGWINVDRIAFGWTAWERLDPAVEASEHGRARRGGTVVAYRDEESPDQAESTRIFTLLDFPGGRPRLVDLRADELEPALVGEPNKYFLRSDAVRLAGIVARKSPKSVGHTEQYQLELAARFLEVAIR